MDEYQAQLATVEVRAMESVRGGGLMAEALPVAEVIQRLDEWGIRLLCRAMEIGVDKFVGGRRMIPQKLFASLFTLGHRAHQADSATGVQLAEHHRRRVQEYLVDHVVPALESKAGESLLREFARRWTDFLLFAEWMRKLYQYLDRGELGLGHPAGWESTMTAAMRVFKETVFDPRKGDINTTLLGMINRERDGLDIDTALVRNVVQMFRVMGLAMVKNDLGARSKLAADLDRAGHDADAVRVYVDDLEAHYIRDARARYARDAELWQSTDDVPTFLVKVERALETEHARVDRFLAARTWSPLQDAMIDVLLRRRQSQILEREVSGMRALLGDDRRADLARLYRLFRLWPEGLEPATVVLRERVVEDGTSIVRARSEILASLAGAKGGPAAAPRARHDPEFVRALMDTYDKYHGIVRECFDSHAKFSKALQAAMGTVVNTNAAGMDDPHPTSELLARYADSLLRGREEGFRTDEAAIMVEATRLHGIVQFLNDKDLFRESYRTLMAKRLLGKESHSDDCERSFIRDLKATQGTSFTAHFEGMLADLRGDEGMRGFSREWVRHAEELGLGGLEFSVDVLCIGHWPQLERFDSVRIPPAMRRAADFFAAKYAEAHGSGVRRLDWVLAEGSTTLRARFCGAVRGASAAASRGGARERELVMKPLQAVVLLMFSNRDSWQLSELATACGLELGIVTQLVHPLCYAKNSRVLSNRTKKGERGTLLGEDVVAFNDGFTSTLRRIRVPCPTLRAQSYNKAHLDTQRNHVIDAACVRIMKARKTSKMEELITEIQKQITQFAPDVRLTKRRIEHLINSDYIERDETDNTVLHYVA